MGLFDGIAELIAPTRCAGCEFPGALLCSECQARLLRIDPVRSCARCGAPYGHLVCTECWQTEFSFGATLALGELEGALARSIVVHKDAGERRLGAVLGELLGAVVAQEWRDWADSVTWIPPTASALSRRGFDHGASLARPVAAVLGSRCEPLLSRKRARDQRVLGRAERLASSAGSFRATAVSPGRVLVVDDVMTTGATIDAAAEALIAAGAIEVRAAVVARAW